MSSFALSPSTTLRDRAPSTHAARRGLLAVLTFALALRIAAAFLFPSPHHPDELFQAFEQAHRYAFGYGLKPWEFEIGLRSTILPALLSLVFRASEALGLPILPAGRIALAVFSLLPVAAIYRAGLRASPVHAMVGGIVAASWCELVNFSFRPLTESLATSFLLTALALVSFREGHFTRRVLALAGACLGAAVMFRIHFAPAALVVALWLTLPRHPGRVISLGLGAAIPVAIFGLADWIAWGVPFHSPITAIRINVFEGAASAFGTSPPGAYVTNMVGLYGPTLALVALPLIKRATAYNVWILTALVILAAHSAIPHKEYRFVFAASSILVVAAAFATVDLLTQWLNRTGREFQPFTHALALTWIAASAVSAALPQQSWARHVSDAEYAAINALAKRSDVCGVLLDEQPWSTSGYVLLRRNVPIYQRWLNTPRPAQPSQAYNYILTSQPTTPYPNYEAIACYTGHEGSDGICLLGRGGTCGPDPSLTPLSALKTLGDPRR